MFIDLTAPDQVKQLRRAGLRPGERLVQHILRAGKAAVAPLLDLALETDLLHDDLPECFAPLHALRLLGELRPPEMLAPLLDALPLELYYAEEELPETWASEVPQIIGRLGADVVEPLWGRADDASRAMAQRGAALLALTYVTAIDPTTHDPIVSGLRERLEHSDDKTFSAHLVVALANIGIPELYKDVMALYREGRIDQEVIPAGVARQLLLSDGENRLACARHPLWERYDQHGPFPDEYEYEA